MSIDWNWFFSSFCQSAAALIGIIGAFIISRLLGLSEKISSTISSFDNLTIERNRIIASISKRRFIWYTTSNIKYDTNVKKEIRAGNFENLSQAEILDKIYKSDSRLYKDDQAVLEIFNELNKVNSPNAISQNFRISDLLITPNGLWDSLRNEKESIDKLEIDAKEIIQKFSQNLQDLESFEGTIKPLRIIIILLMIAFPITVIYPLHFMPLATNKIPNITFNILIILKSFITLKSILLIAFFSAIEGIFYYFIILTNQLGNRLSIARRKNSIEIRSIKNYSEYFENV